MDTSTISGLAELMAASGPYGLLAIVVVFFYKFNDRKDKEIKEMHERMVELAEKQTAAITKVEAALQALRSAIEGLRFRG